MTAQAILMAIGQTVLVGGLAFGVICLLISSLRFQLLTRSLRSASHEDADARDKAFQLHIARQLGTAHRHPAPFTVMLVTLVDWPQLVEQAGHETAVELAGQCEQRLRGLVRRTDLVIRYRTEVMAMLLQAGRGAAEAIALRVLAEAAREPFRPADGKNVHIKLLAGAAAYPEDGDRAGILRTKAETALQQALVTGISPQWPPDAVVSTLPTRVSHSGQPDEEMGDQSALLDELTGVLKESHLGQALQKYVAQCRRDERPVSVICLDIDFLRRYNDQYGRRTGDQLLRHVADFLKHATREDDLVARYAGDQFVIALPALPKHAFAVAQRIWSGLRRTAFEGSGPGLRLTVTLGVAGFPEHGLIGRELFESAQLALRVAKSKGRNQCLLYQDAMQKLAAAGEANDAF